MKQCALFCWLQNCKCWTWRSQVALPRRSDLHAMWFFPDICWEKERSSTRPGHVEVDPCNVGAVQFCLNMISLFLWLQWSGVVFLWLVQLSAMPNKHCVKSCPHRFGGVSRAKRRGWPDYILIALLLAASVYSAVCSHRLLTAHTTVADHPVSARLFITNRVPRKTIFRSLYIYQPVVPYAGEPKKGQNWL